jgi:hypothetical protein
MGLHALVDRIVVAKLGDWDVRRHDESEGPHSYFARRGFLHLQLWQPIARVSVLTPSRLTNGRFEIWRDGLRISQADWHGVTRALAGIAVPSAAEIDAFCRWTVVRDARAFAAGGA